VDHLPEVAAVRDALMRASFDPAKHEDEVRATVCAMVDSLRRAGWPIEAIIVLAKKMATDAGLHVWQYCTPPVWAGDTEDLAHSIVRWCIQHYYPEWNCVRST
jgi:hypothetical protein